MNCDMLLHWMTHLGDGTWAAFRSAVMRLAETDADIDGICRRLRVTLSDMGHADFFVAGSQRWRALPPMLAGLPGSSSPAVLIGGRTRTLVERLTSAAAARACRVSVEAVNDAPSRIRIEGAQQSLSEAAAEAGIRHIPEMARSLCSAIVPVPVQVKNAQSEEAPANWSVRSFDLESLIWTDGLQSRSACEYSSRYGPRRFYVHKRLGHLLRLPKRDAVYAAAMLNGVKLAVYDRGAKKLSTPLSAPLPESLARAACLCTDAQAKVENGRLVYANVPPDLAAVLLVAAGEPYPNNKA